MSLNFSCCAVSALSWLICVVWRCCFSVLKSCRRFWFFWCVSVEFGACVLNHLAVLLRSCKLMKAYCHQVSCVPSQCSSLLSFISYCFLLCCRWRFPQKRWPTFLCTLWASTARQRAMDTKAKSISESVFCLQRHEWDHKSLNESFDINASQPKSLYTRLYTKLVTCMQAFWKFRYICWTFLFFPAASRLITRKTRSSRK